MEIEGFNPDPQEFAAAAQRLTATAGEHGGREPAAVGWLLSFVQTTDALYFPPSVVDTTLWEVLRFSADGGQEGADYAQTGGFRFPSPFSLSLEQKRVALSTLQTVVGEAVLQYLNVGVYSFPQDAAGFTITRGYPSVLFSGRSLAAGFYYMASQLLARYGHRVRICEGCPTILLMGRKDQRFHSKQCQVGTFIRKQRAGAKAARAKDQAARLAKARARKANSRRSPKRTHTGGRGR
jgi:hypothetical protein